MAPPSPLPKYVYKIVPTAPPSPIPAKYPPSDLDAKDGFIHLSTGWQIPNTASLFFKDSASLWIIKIRFSWSDQTNWDTPGCPHLYGNFGAADVDSIREFTKAGGETWEQLLGKESGWLE